MPPDASPEPGQIARQIAALLSAEHFGNGPRAALRRMDPEKNLGQPALQRLLADYVPDHWLYDGGMADWGLIVHSLALGSPGNLGGKSLGAALAQAQYSESRLARLLQADRKQLNDALPRACRFLVAKGEAINPAGIANFVLTASDARADAARVKIARDFYRASRPAATQTED
jgi:CRISPR system Cascade subunit CasB